MFRSHTTNLSPDQRSRVHPEFLANEQSYVQMRDALLATHRGRWVAIMGGRVVADGDDLIQVMEAADAYGDRPYIVKVGEEDDVVFQVRRAEFPYDAAYRPFPLPRVTALFSDHRQNRSIAFNDVIPDTGADVSVLPDTDCIALGLFNAPYLTGVFKGVVGAGVATLIYRGKVEINGLMVTALIQSVSGIKERIIGRDVLNRHRVVFDGPNRRVAFEP